MIIPKLDAFLAAGAVPRGTRSPHETLSRIVERMCSEKNEADLASMRSYLEQRVASHPGETYARIADEASSARCKPSSPKKHTR